jgi:hypothetical protein
VFRKQRLIFRVVIREARDYFAGCRIIVTFPVNKPAAPAGFVVESTERHRRGTQGLTSPRRGGVFRNPNILRRNGCLEEPLGGESSIGKNLTGDSRPG